MQIQVQDVGFGYSPYPHELARDRRLSLQAKGLFAVYGSFTHVSDPTAFPSETHLCELCGGINPQTMRKYKRELLAAGWISQEQRIRSNGQFSSLLVTRYASPALNPHHKPISTDDEKTTVGKSGAGKFTPQEQKQKILIKNHKDTLPTGQPPCVFSEISPEQQACIDWTIQETQKTGKLKNEAGLRHVLERAAREGSLKMDAYLACKSALIAIQTASNDILQRADEWKRAQEENPPNWAELRQLHPHLFRSRSRGEDRRETARTPRPGQARG